MGDPHKPLSRPWWTRLRWSVRSLIIAVLLIGLGLGWMVHLMRSVQVQRNAVMAIQSAGGSVWYDWEWQEGSPSPTPTISFWEWHPGCVSLPWDDLILVDYVRPIVYVFLLHAGSDAEMVHIGHLTYLEVLYLNGTRVTDAGLAHVAGLTGLQYLSLGGTKITDAGLKHLKGLTNLRGLNLINTNVTDVGIREIQRALPQVRIDH